MVMVFKNFWFQFCLAVAVATAVIFWQAQNETPDIQIGDTYAYASVAKELADTGVFTDGGFKDRAAIKGPEGQGMFFAPLYPALLAVVGLFDPHLYKTMACRIKENHQNCANDFGALRGVHIALATVSAFLVWLAGWVVTGRYSVAWIAMVLGLLAEAYAYYTAQIMTENLVFPLFTASCVAATAAWKKKSARLWLVTGLFLGLSALTRPSFIYLFYAAIPLVTLLSLLQKDLPGQQKLKWPLLLLTGYFLTAGPWIIRNGLSMGEFAVTKGYASYILVQRVSYNNMTWKEWGISFIYGLPDFGDSLAKNLFKPADYERFDYQNPDGFYKTGFQRLRLDTIEKAGGLENHLSWLLKHEVADNLFKHVMVTLSLAWRGMWISKYWGLVTIPLFCGVFFWATHRRWGEFLILALPPWFMLGFHAFTSVNVVRYNLILIPVLSVAAAFLLTAVISSIKKCVPRQERQGL